MEGRFKKLKEEMKRHDKEDKLLHKQRLREKRTKEKMKLKQWREEEEGGLSGADSDLAGQSNKRHKIYFDSDSDEGSRKLPRGGSDFAPEMSVDAQVDLALQLLNNMNS